MDGGWIPVSEILDKLKISMSVLETIVASDTKGRYEFSTDLTLIRACQGHSVQVDLGYSPKIPPEVLFHGTGEQNVEIIKHTGIKKMSRHHVHLSANKETASQVGARYGTPNVLEVNAGQMHCDGYKFYESNNGVWLVEFVPSKYIKN